MNDNIKAVENRYEELNQLISDPAIMADQDRYRRLLQEHGELIDMVSDYRAWLKLGTDIEEHRVMLSQADDHEFRELVRVELGILENQYQILTERLKDAMTPKDPNDRRNVVIEIRAGAGGEEAALFVAVLFRMYSNYAEQRGWHADLVDTSETELGGYKEIVFVIEGAGAYSRLRYESGVHRVQRVPVTESGGRIHTSTVTVAVLPEADDVEVTINPNDLEIDTYRASGAGGQHINKTDSAIRVTHKPSGIVVTCQDQRSQYKNKDQAMAVLKAKLLEREQNRQSSAIASDRRSQVGTGDRSERIRTYNYHQGRVTDHRIGLTLYRLNDVLEGDLDEIISALMQTARSNQLSNVDHADQD